MVVRILNFIQRLALCYWLGEMLFFIIVYAPRVFKVLDKETAGKLQAAIFPAYYNTGILAGLVFVVATIALWKFGPLKGWNPKRLGAIFAFALFALIIFYYSLTSITPELTELRPKIVGLFPNADARVRFDELHSLSVRLNASALFALLATLFSI